MRKAEHLSCNWLVKFTVTSVKSVNFMLFTFFLIHKKGHICSPISSQGWHFSLLLDGKCVSCTCLSQPKRMVSTVQTSFVSLCAAVEGCFFSVRLWCFACLLGAENCGIKEEQPLVRALRPTVSEGRHCKDSLLSLSCTELSCCTVWRLVRDSQPNMHRVGVKNRNLDLQRTSKFIATRKTDHTGMGFFVLPLHSHHANWSFAWVMRYLLEAAGSCMWLLGLPKAVKPGMTYSPEVLERKGFLCLLTQLASFVRGPGFLFVQKEQSLLLRHFKGHRKVEHIMHPPPLPKWQLLASKLVGKRGGSRHKSDDELIFWMWELFWMRCSGQW